MGYRIGCSTLFDITQTGILNRHKPVNIGNEDWIYRRNTQCNFDTILQVISLRSQPEVVKIPNKSVLDNSDTRFGKIYRNINLTCWNFEFEVQHPMVFGENFSLLYNDCSKVPMIYCNTQYKDLPLILSAEEDNKNIHFELL